MGTSDVPNDNDRQEPPSWQRIIADFVIAYANAQGAKKEQDDGNNRAANWTAAATVAIAIFTFATIGVGIAQWRILSGTLNEMQAEQRPWVRVTPSFPQPMIFPRSDWSILPVQMTVENVGHSPAFNVQVSVFSYFPSSHEPDPVAFEKRKCEPLRRQPLLIPGYGVTLFPGEKNDHPEGSHVQGVIGISPSDSPSHVTNDAGRKVFMLSAVGCVDYIFGAPPTHHQTGFHVVLAHRIHRPNMGDAMSYEFSVGEAVSPADIIMENPQASSLNTD